MTATTIKVSTELRDRLNEAAREEGLTAGSFIERLLELHLRERRFAAMREAMARTDAASWTSYEAETAAWDHTLTDESR
jgi:predicted transcriptional regulator